MWTDFFELTRLITRDPTSTPTPSDPMNTPGTTDNTKKPYDLSVLFSPYVPREEPANDGSASDAAQVLSQSTTAVRPVILPGIFDENVDDLSPLCEDEPLLSWLVRAAGLVSSRSMATALESSKSQEVPIDEILRLAGRLTLSDLRALRSAENLVSRGLIHKRFAAAALAHACRFYVELEDALWSLNLHPSDPFVDNKLVALLEDTSLVDQVMLRNVLAESLAAGMSPLRGIIANNLVSEQLLKVLMECLGCVREKTLDYRVLTHCIQEVCVSTNTGNTTLEAELIRRLRISSFDRTLGNLLLGSELLSRHDLLRCMEISVEEETSMADVVTAQCLVDSTLLRTAMMLSSLLCKGELSARECVEHMERTKITGRPPELTQEIIGETSGSRWGSFNMAAFSA